MGERKTEQQRWFFKAGGKSGHMSQFNFQSIQKKVQQFFSCLGSIFSWFKKYPIVFSSGTKKQLCGEKDKEKVFYSRKKYVEKKRCCIVERNMQKRKSVVDGFPKWSEKAVIAFPIAPPRAAPPRRTCFEISTSSISSTFSISSISTSTSSSSRGEPASKLALPLSQSLLCS